MDETICESRGDEVSIDPGMVKRRLGSLKENRTRRSLPLRTGPRPWARGVPQRRRTRHLPSSSRRRIHRAISPFVIPSLHPSTRRECWGQTVHRVGARPGHGHGGSLPWRRSREGLAMTTAMMMMQSWLQDVAVVMIRRGRCSRCQT